MAVGVFLSPLAVAGKIEEMANCNIEGSAQPLEGFEARQAFPALQVRDGFDGPFEPRRQVFLGEAVLLANGADPYSNFVFDIHTRILIRIWTFTTKKNTYNWNYKYAKIYV
ncbi:MAG: hypothetical protein V3V55_08930 [Rhodospirillales bacterium]